MVVKAVKCTHKLIGTCQTNFVALRKTGGNKQKKTELSAFRSPEFCVNYGVPPTHVINRKKKVSGTFVKYST